MGRRFSPAAFSFFTLSAILFLLQAQADGSAADSFSDSLSLRHRSLLQNPESEKSIADPPSADDEERETPAEAPAEWESRKMGKHHASDKSVAGGGVIIGGFVTAIFAAVYCYIRVTRKRHTEALR